MTGKADEYQPLPTDGKKIVKDYVLQDIQERVKFGYDKYGHYLETDNGRDALWDAYQEVLDLVMYLRQAILERDTDAMHMWNIKLAQTVVDLRQENFHLRRALELYAEPDHWQDGIIFDEWTLNPQGNLIAKEALNKPHVPNREGVDS